MGGEMAPRDVTDTWRVIGASVQGTSHEDAGVPCQDAHCFKICPAASS